MLRQTCLILLSAVVCAGSSCSDGVSPSRATPLHEADAAFTIIVSGDEESAVVSARITRGFSNVVLEDDQSVSVNGESLERFGGEYRATIDAAATYTIRVQEPTRGIDQSSVSAPDAFEITSPSEGGNASLSGFTLEWISQAGADVEILLTQDLLGENLRLEVGPVSDTGLHDFSAAELADAGFGQGVPITIVLTKIVSHAGIAGFDDAEVTIRWTQAIDVNPGP